MPIFDFAQYSSPPDDPGGYRWTLCSSSILPGWRDAFTQELERKRCFPLDGRKLGDGFQGGIFLCDEQKVGVVFRFLNGGCDAGNRAGVVVMNCFFFQLDEVIGKNPEPIFNHSYLDDASLSQRQLRVNIPLVPSTEKSLFSGADSRFAVFQERLADKNSIRTGIYLAGEQNSTSFKQQQTASLWPKQKKQKTYNSSRYRQFVLGMMLGLLLGGVGVGGLFWWYQGREKDSSCLERYEIVSAQNPHRRIAILKSWNNQLQIEFDSAIQIKPLSETGSTVNLIESYESDVASESDGQ